MKTSLHIILLLSFFSTITIAQEEYPFVKEGAVWSEYQFNSFVSVQNNKYGIIGDTMIQDTLYQKVYSWQTDLLDISQAAKTIHGYVREENKIVIFKKQGTNVIGKSDTLYNPNWAIGDSLGLTGDDVGFEIRIEILSKDSILINNEYRMVTNFHGIYFDSLLMDTFLLDSYIDGIGSVSEIFWSPQTPEIGYTHRRRMTCYHENNELFYADVDPPVCFVPTVNNINISRKNDFDVFPNPSQNIFFIKNKSEQDLEVGIEIFDFQKNIVSRSESFFPKNQTIEIKINHLSSGIYFLKIKHNNTFTVEKIVIQK
jgi:hypothetical protein